MRYSVSFTTGWNAWGNLYEGMNYLDSKAYPAGLFINTPTALVGRSGAAGGGVLWEIEGQSSISKSPRFYPVRGNNPGNLSIDISIMIIGRWK